MPRRVPDYIERARIPSLVSLAALAWKENKVFKTTLSENLGDLNLSEDAKDIILETRPTHDCFFALFEEKVPLFQEIRNGKEWIYSTDERALSNDVCKIVVGTAIEYATVRIKIKSLNDGIVKRSISNYHLYSIEYTCPIGGETIKRGMDMMNNLTIHDHDGIEVPIRLKLFVQRDGSEAYVYPK